MNGGACKEKQREHLITGRTFHSCSTARWQGRTRWRRIARGIGARRARSGRATVEAPVAANGVVFEEVSENVELLIWPNLLAFWFGLRRFAAGTGTVRKHKRGLGCLGPKGGSYRLSEAASRMREVPALDVEHRDYAEECGGGV